MSLQKRLWDLIVLGIFVFAATFVSAPWFAFRALKAAAQYEDVQAVGELVDFPLVRKSLTAQLDVAAPASAPEPPSIWRNPLDVFKRAMGPMAPPEPKVDRYLTIGGLQDLTRGYAPGGAPKPGARPVTLAERAKAAVTGPQPGIATGIPTRADRHQAAGRAVEADDLHLRAQGAVHLASGACAPAARRALT
ncbi:DUF2939 domain-containing protein, partial [Caulobacter sp. B11]|uniref:DUF2939 domain-containing protein n=1 Tax=Caulobacter sp. B11 TaxID=2048899 RepID=UPI001F1A9659